MITKDDDLIIGDWLESNHSIFDTIVVVDGSVSEITKNCANKYSNVLYLRDPTCHITDQTLRHHGWCALQDIASLGDWVYMCHADEFFINSPRDFMHESANTIYWMPLQILPHPSEAESWIRSETKNPRELFKHYWWRRGSVMHVEERMLRYVKPLEWNLQIKQPSCGVFPHNYSEPNEKIANKVPLYFHYKCYDLSPDAYKEGGDFKKSNLTTSIYRSIHGFDDLFFYEKKPFDSHNAYDNNHNGIHERFGNPPRVALGPDGKITLINDLNQMIHTL